MQSVIELAKAQGMSEEMIKRIVANANKSMVIAKKRRNEHKWAQNGWSRGKHLLSQSVMTTGLYLLFKDRYFPDGADDHEKAKLAEQFARDYPQFASRMK